jgi:PAS domain S-box-containing protein
MKSSSGSQRILTIRIPQVEKEILEGELKEFKFVDYTPDVEKLPSGIKCIIASYNQELPEIIKKINSSVNEPEIKTPLLIIAAQGFLTNEFEAFQENFDLEVVLQPVDWEKLKKDTRAKAQINILQQDLALTRQEILFLQKKSINNEHRLNVLSATVNEPIVFINEEFLIKFWNKHAENVFGYSKFEVLSEDIFRSIISPRSQEQITEIFNQALKKSNRTFNVDHSFFVRNKHKVEFETDATISVHHLGQDSYNLVIVFHDLQNAKRLEKEIAKTNELKEENKILREFIQTVSHDLRTPMNAILGIAKTLLKYNSANLTDKQREGLDIIYQSGNDLVNLIRDLLDLVRMERGKFELNNEYFDFDKMLSIQKTQVLHLLGNKSIKFTLKKSPSVPPILIGDHRKIGQILTNLLTNAVKYTNKGRIVLSAHLIQNKLFFEIADTGIGISEDKIKVITNKFVQADATFIASGVGLGLNISSKLVQMMHGEMTFESIPGEGTIVRFYITLPDDINISNIQSGGKLETEEYQVFNFDENKKLVVAIDDNEKNAYIYSLVSESSEFSVVLARNGKSGLNAITQLNPDIILLKLEVPELHGTALIKMLQRLKLDIPVLAITDYENMPINLPAHVLLLLQPFTVEQIHQNLSKFDIKQIKLKRKYCTIYEETSKFSEEKELVGELYFLLNKNIQLSLLQLNKYSFEYLIVEQTAGLRNSGLVLKIIETELYWSFREIILLVDGQPMKYLTQKIENCSNIRVIQTNEFVLKSLN